MSLSSGNAEDSLRFSLDEADTIMLSIYVVLRSSGYSNPVVIDAENRTCTFRLQLFHMTYQAFSA